LRLSPFVPHIIGLLLIGTVAIGSYYAVASASSSTPKAIWSTNPITISGGTGHATDSFKCAPPFTGSVVLTVSNPLLLSVSPSSFSSCGPSFTAFTLTAHSATSATLLVTIHLTSQSGTGIPPSLS